MSRFARLCTIVAAALAVSGQAYANQRVWGFCEQGGKYVYTSGAPSTTKVQASYPQCTVTVYPAGNPVPVAGADIHSDNVGTVKGNPFSADVNGYWYFYAANGRYDVKLSGGGLAAPWTISDVLLADPAGTPVPTGVAVGNGASWTGVTGSMLQYLRRKPNVATATYEFASLPERVSTDYNFAAITPTGNLTLGVDSTITLPAYSPLGVAQANTNHYLYITDAISGNETVLINSAGAGTCTSGLLAACTLSIDGASISANHTAGNYTITSATAGIEEAIWVAGEGGHVFIPAGTHTIQATITVPTYTAFNLSGAGFTSAFLDYQPTTGNCVTFNAAGGYVNISDFAILGPDAAASGTLLSITQGTWGRVHGVFLKYGYDAFYVGAPNELIVDNVQTYLANHYACHVKALAGTVAVGKFSGMTCSADTTVAGSRGLVIEAVNTGSVAGLEWTASIFGGIAGIEFIDNGGAATALNECTFTGCTITATTYGILDSSTTAAGQGINSLKWVGGTYLATTGAGPLAGPAILLKKNTHGALFANSVITANGAQPTVYLMGAENVTFENNKIYNSSTGNAIQIDADSDGTVSGHVFFRNNNIGISPDGAPPSQSTKGLAVSAAAHNTIVTIGNEIAGSTAAVEFSSTGTGNYFAANHIEPTSGAAGKPACAAGVRGSLWYTPGGAGVADLSEICEKNTADAYAWLPQTNIVLAETPLTTRGDLLVVNSTPALARLAKGTQYQTLQGGAADPAWGAVALSQATAVTGILGSANGGTGNGFAKISGPTTAEKTLTVPDADVFVASRVALYEVTNQDVTVASGNLLASAPAGLYQASLYIHTKVAAGGACTAAVVLGWTYNGGAKTITMAAAHDLNSDEASSAYTTTIKADAATNITRTITVAGAGCSGAQRWDATIPLVRLN